MAYFLWVGTGAGQNLGTLANYRISDAAGLTSMTPTNSGPAVSLPVAGDTVYVRNTASVGLNGNPATGSSPATFHLSGSGITTPGTIYGGTYDGPISAVGIPMSNPPGNVNGATLNANSNLLGGTNSGCTVNGTVTSSGNGYWLPTFVNSTVNGAITGSIGANHGTGVFNVAVTVQVTSPSQLSGTFNAPVTVSGTNIGFGGVINHKVTFGSTVLYSANSPDLAPPVAVLATASNLGVAGTYRPRKILGTKG
jgi:hypothetical protein